MFKLIRKLWIACTGWMWGHADSLNENLHVVNATYDKAQDKKANRINVINDAVGKIIASKEEKLEKIKDLEAECEELERAKLGAQKLAQKRAKELQAEGKSKEEAGNDPEYIRCRTGYQDAASTLAEKRQRIEEYEQRIEADQQTISHHTSELQSLKSELERLHEEQAETTADMESNKAVEEANKTLAGVAQDTTDKDLAAVRKKRREVAGRAKAAQQLAGTDAKRATESFIEFAKQEEAASEFDDLMDWDEDEPTETNREASKLPE